MARTTITTVYDDPISSIEVEIWQTESGEWRSRRKATFTGSEDTDVMGYELSHLLRTADRTINMEIDRIERKQAVEQFQQAETEAPDGRYEREPDRQHNGSAD